MRFAPAALAALLVTSGRAEAGPKLQGLFSPDMLRIQVAFLELVVGPARRVYQGASGAQTREYVVDRCDVTARVKDGEVVAYGMRLTKACSADVSKLMGRRFVVTQATTFSQFTAAFGNSIGGDTFYASCLGSCGNAADPTATYKWEGPHAMGFINVDLTATIAGDASIAAAFRWRDEILKNEGEAYVSDARFNCSPKYRSMGLSLFRQVPLSEVVIGYDTGDQPGDACPK